MCGFVYSVTYCLWVLWPNVANLTQLNLLTVNETSLQHNEEWIIGSQSGFKHAEGECKTFTFSSLPLIQIDNLIMLDMKFCQQPSWGWWWSQLLLCEKKNLWSLMLLCDIIWTELLTMCCIALHSVCILGEAFKRGMALRCFNACRLVKRIITKFKGKWWHSPVSRWVWAPWKPYDLFTQSLLST